MVQSPTERQRLRGKRWSNGTVAGFPLDVSFLVCLVSIDFSTHSFFCSLFDTRPILFCSYYTPVVDTARTDVSYAGEAFRTIWNFGGRNTFTVPLIDNWMRPTMMHVSFPRRRKSQPKTNQNGNHRLTTFHLVHKRWDLLHFPSIGDMYWT